MTMSKKPERKNLNGKLTLNKKTISNLSRQAMEGLHGGTGEVCESILYSCDPEKYYCETAILICPNPLTG